MTPKQKAVHIIVSYMGVLGNNRESAKQCALTTMKEIMALLESSLYDEQYWQEVKNEIEKL